MLLSAVPFVPFAIEMASGKSYRVEHPDFVLMDNDSPEVVVEEPTGLAHILNPMLITAIEHAPNNLSGAV